MRSLKSARRDTVPNSEDIGCPQGREPVGTACVCPDNKVEVRGTCMRRGEAPPGITDDGGVAPVDGGSTEAEAGTTEPTSRLTPTHPAEAATPDLSTPPPSPPAPPRPGPTSSSPGPMQPAGIGTPIGLILAERCLATCENSKNRCDSEGECVPVPNSCFDGIKGPDEECDDGNRKP